MWISRPFGPWVARAAVMLLVAQIMVSCDAREEPVAETSVNVPEPAAPARSAAPKISAAAAAPVITAEGYGPLRVGMSLAEVTSALGPDADPEAVGGADPAQCDQFRPARAPEGMLVMMEKGRLTRISLMRGNRTKTDRGVGLGSTANAVLAAYGDAARASPHKYSEPPARYLTVWTKAAPASAAQVASADARGIVFEMDGRALVGTIHAGGPSIQYVEGCA